MPHVRSVIAQDEFMGPSAVVNNYMEDHIHEEGLYNQFCIVMRWIQIRVTMLLEIMINGYTGENSKAERVSMTYGFK